MKFSVKTVDIQRAVGQAIRGTNKNSQLPVLKCILFSTTRSTITLRATNLELGIEVVVPGEAQEVGMVAIPGETIKQFIDTLGDTTTVLFEVVDGTVLVRSGKYEARFAAHPHEDFPHIPHSDTEGVVKIDIHKFFSGLRSVWYAAAQASMKPELSSVFVLPKQNTITYAATDSFRLAEKIVQLDKVKEFDPVLIPIKNAIDIIRIFENAEGVLELAISENQLSCTHDNTHVTTRLINGTFPDYEQIIPKASTTEIVVLKQDLVQALKVSHVLANAFHQVRIVVEKGGDSFMIHTQTSGIGESTVVVPAKVTGETIDMSFNYRYITDCFQSITTDSILLQFAGAGKPLIIRGVSDQTFRYLTMPMNR